MEEPILELAFNNLLEELKEVKQEQQKVARTLLTLTEKVEGFEQKLSSIKVTPPAVNMAPVITTISQELDKINSTIEAQPKSVTRQVRILLFPEYNAREYYGLVFGRLLMWIVFIFIATYYICLVKNIYKYMLMEGETR